MRMAAVGICGTELHSIRGEWERPTPSVLGHEGAGVVEAVGDAVTLVRPGDEVVLSWAPSCGDCADCRRGRPAACVNLHRAIGNGTLVDGTTGMTIDGETLYRGTATGCLQERVTVTERCALPIGGGVSLEEAALLGCAALTGVGSVLFAGRTQPGEVVLIIGAGGVGQFCVQGARIAGASTIVVVDPLEARLELARELGATHTTDPDGLKALMKGIAPDGADRAFDVVGNPETSALALRFTRSGGTCVIVGIPATGERLDLDFAEFNRREKFLTGTMYGSEDPAVALPILLDHVRAGRLKLRELLGPTYPLEQVNDAFEASLGRLPRPCARHARGLSAVRVALISQIPRAVEGYTNGLRALGHEPVGLLTPALAATLDPWAQVEAAQPGWTSSCPRPRAHRAAPARARARPRALRRLPLEVPPDTLAVPRSASSTSTRRCCRATAARRRWPGRSGTARPRSASPSTGWPPTRHRADPRPGSARARRRVVVGRARPRFAGVVAGSCRARSSEPTGRPRRPAGRVPGRVPVVLRARVRRDRPEPAG